MWIWPCVVWGLRCLGHADAPMRAVLTSSCASRRKRSSIASLSASSARSLASTTWLESRHARRACRSSLRDEHVTVASEAGEA